MRAAAVNIHASCVKLGRAGILLLGPSGAGKSDLALRLIAGGALLVADDRTDLFVRNSRLFARAPSALAALIEIRGLGLMELPCCGEAPLRLVVQLGSEGPRLPEPGFYMPPKPLQPAKLPPLIALDGLSASAPARIEAALAAFSKNLFRDAIKPK